MKNTGTQMTPTALRAGTYTVCLDTQKAQDDTYMNWITVRLTRVGAGHYTLERKSNASGNGQIWVQEGSIRDGELYFWGDQLDFVNICCGTILARHFGLRYATSTSLLFPNARVWRPTSKGATQVGRKTAAPTLLGRGRDKNRNMERERVAALDFAAQMRARLA